MYQLTINRQSIISDARPNVLGFEVSPRSYLMRKSSKKFELIEGLIPLTGNADLLELFLRDEYRRTLLDEYLNSYDMLQDVLTKLFGGSLRIHVGAPIYNSIRLYTVISEVAVKRNLSTDEMVINVYASIINDMLNAFDIRFDAFAKRTVIINDLPLFPSLSYLRAGVVTLQLKDGFLNALQSAKKKIGKPAAKQINLEAYTEHLYYALRDLSEVLFHAKTRQREFDDVLQLTAALLRGDTSYDHLYGVLRNNNDLIHLLGVANIAELAKDVYTPQAVVSIPAHQLSAVCSTVFRNITQLRDYEVATNLKDVIDVVITDMGGATRSFSAKILPHKVSVPKAAAYRIVPQRFHEGLVDVVPADKLIGNVLPTVPADMLRGIQEDTINYIDYHTAEGLRVGKGRRALHVTSFAPEDSFIFTISALMSSSAQLVQDEWHYTITKGLDLYEEIIGDQVGMLCTTSAILATVMGAPRTEEYQPVAEFADDLPPLTKFIGNWVGGNRRSAASMQMAIGDLIDGKFNYSMPIVPLPNLDLKYIDVVTNDGWFTLAGEIKTIIQTINSIRVKERHALMAGTYRTYLANLFQKWITRDAAILSLINRTHHAVSMNLVSDGLIDDVEVHAFENMQYASTALQVVVEVLREMSSVDGESPIDGEVTDFLYHHDMLINMVKF